MSLTFGRRALLAVVCAVAVGSVYAAQPALEQMGRDLALPRGQWGWIVAVGQLGYLVGLVALVPLGDLMDRRRLIAAHLVLAAGGVALAATATTTWVVFVGLAVAGLFAVVVQIAVAYTATLSAPEERGRNLGTVTSGVVLGILGSRVAAGAMAEVWGWRSVYYALAGLLLLLALLALRLLPRDPRVERTAYRHVLASLGGLFRERLFLSRGLIAFFLFSSFGALWSGLALPLTGEPWHLDAAQIGLFGLAGLVGAIGATRAGRWADAGFSSPVTGAALLLLIGSWLLIGQASWSLWLLILGVIVLDFAVQAVHVSNQHALTTTHPDRTSSIIGGYMVFYSLGSALGATSTTVAFATTGWSGSSMLGGVFAGCALIAWAVGRRDVRSREKADLQ